MSKRSKNIIAVLVILLPFYLSAIVQKFLFNQNEILIQEFFGYYMMLSVAGLAVVLLTNRFLLKNNFEVFLTPKRKVIYDLVLAFLLLGSSYFIQSVEQITYANWFSFERDRTAITNLLESIFSNYLYALIILGPFTWFEEAFTVFTVSFILYNLWELNSTRIWTWTTIFFTASLLALLQVNNGPSAMISSFILISFSNYIFFKYRSILPLFIAGVLFQTIDLITYWAFTI
ncbi:hypothetical protein [uncultured Draconibacterium sp.]|uniref:hypothetical protein n=1 Tax=uncultured Draconibacterium sp. TaxID=1573823 RepID=UPI002AA7891E|nr:hypothetical protein [uncultured Draconibacterium sp.]